MNHLIDPFDVLLTEISILISINQIVKKKIMLEKQHEVIALLNFLGVGKHFSWNLQPPTTPNPKHPAEPLERDPWWENRWRKKGFHPHWVRLQLSIDSWLVFFQGFDHDRMIHHFWSAWSNLKSSFHVENKTRSWHWTCFRHVIIWLITVIVDGGIIWMLHISNTLNRTLWDLRDYWRREIENSWWWPLAKSTAMLVQSARSTYTLIFQCPVYLEPMGVQKVENKHCLWNTRIC